MGSSDQNRMKKLLLSSAILSLVLGAQVRASTNHDALSEAAIAAPTAAAAPATQVAAASDLLLRPAAAQKVSVQLVGIGDNRSDQRIGRSAGQQAPDQELPGPEGLPSTPVALGALLLLLCMLIGRRNV
jgi:hypothetical protein